MAKVAVFDSGLGSLSVIKAIQRAIRCEIIYFADRANFPYGKKSRLQLSRIISKTIKELKREFAPDVMVMASNTPSLVLNNRDVIGVYPPVKAAAEISVTKHIAVLGTSLAVHSRHLDRYIARQGLPKVTIHRIDASPLVKLVETGKFLTDRSACRREIKKGLCELHEGVDAATLSSTHLPFLKPLLVSEFPHVKFLDPADMVATQVAGRINEGQNRLRVYASGDTDEFERNLSRLGIRRRVRSFSV